MPRRTLARPGDIFLGRGAAPVTAVSPTSAGSTITAVEAIAAEFPLLRPIRLGDMTIASREFVFVRVVTADGFDGAAFALSRGLPVAEVVRRSLAPLLLGQDGDAIERCVDRCTRSIPAPARPGIWMRAMSLVEIALWDLRGKRLRAPLWRLLGGYEPEVAVQLVADYAAPGDDPRAVGERVGALSREGYRTIKLARAPTAEATRDQLRSCRDAITPDTRLVVDAAWCWRSVEEARRELETWECGDLAWLEDPFDPVTAPAFARLRRLTGIPVGAGDEVTEAAVLIRLLEIDGVDILRADATALGGISALRAVCSYAAAQGVPVSLHAYSEVHLHCAAAWPGTMGVELFEPESAVYPTAQFVLARPPVVNGRIRAPDTPGLGLSLDWEHIARRDVRRVGG